METPPVHGWGYTLDFHYVFPDLAGQYRLALVPFLLTGALNPDLNGDDLVHPNAAGAKAISATVWTFLLPLVQEDMKSLVE